MAVAKNPKIAPKITVKKPDLLIGDKKSIVGYHTLEHRNEILKHPVKCVRDDARLGFAYYFWIEEDFAHFWGQIKQTDYDVYTATLNIKNCLNTVFNEEHYLFFRIVIKEAIQQFKKRGVSSVTLEMVNIFLAKNFWQKYGIECIIYDDKPTNKPKKNLIYSEIPDLYYNKRIQVAVFDAKDIQNFKLYLENQKPI